MLELLRGGSTRSRLLLVFLLTSWAVSFLFILPLFKNSVNFIDTFFEPSRALHFVGQCDFSMFWAVSRIQAAGQLREAYNVQHLLRWEALNTPTKELQLPWFYPPPGFLFTSLLKNIAFFPAFFLWTVGILVLSVVVLLVAELAWPVILVALGSPAVLMATDFGQIAFLTGALTAAGLLLAERRPFTAGVLLGALAYKPQAAVLAPFIFLGRRKWLGICAGGLIVSGICILTTYICGGAIWHEFIEHGLPVARQILIEPFPKQPPPISSSDEFYGISVFWMLRSVGAGLLLSTIAQITFATTAIVLCWWVWTIKGADPVARAAITSCLSILVTPYSFLYDMTVTSILFTALVWQEKRLCITDVVLFVWPVWGLIISLNFYLELAPISLVLSARRAWCSLHTQEPNKTWPTACR